MKYTDAIRAHAWGDIFEDMIEKPWANAADAAPRSRPSDQAAARPAASRFDRISQEHRERGVGNGSPSNHDGE